jgi:UPF0716 protein FxsA
MWLLILLIGVPLVEIALFIEVGGLLGLWPTLGIVVATAVVGTLLLRAQGTAAWGSLQRRLAAGDDPSGALAHGALILVSGVVLMTPGFFTDAVGLALLVPPVRSAVIRMLAHRVTVVHARREAAREAARDPSETVIEGDFEEVDGEGRDDDRARRR